MNMQCACVFEPINRKVETPLWSVRSSCKTVFFYLKIPININCQQNINKNVIYSKIIARKCNMMRIFHHRLQDLLMSSNNLLLFLIFGILLVVTSYALYFPFCLILAPHALFWQNLPAAYSKRDKLRDINRC